MKKYKFKINNDKYEAKILEYKNEMVLVEVNGERYQVDIEMEKRAKKKLVRAQKSESPAVVKTTPKVVTQVSAGAVVAPIPGLVLKVLVKNGDVVEVGQTVIILEAMKMESEIHTDRAGKVNNILVKEGENIQEGQAIIEVGE